MQGIANPHYIYGEQCRAHNVKWNYLYLRLGRITAMGIYMRHTVVARIGNDPASLDPSSYPKRYRVRTVGSDGLASGNKFGGVNHGTASSG